MLRLLLLTLLVSLFLSACGPSSPAPTTPPAVPTVSGLPEAPDEVQPEVVTPVAQPTPSAEVGAESYPAPPVLPTSDPYAPPPVLPTVDAYAAPGP